MKPFPPEAATDLAGCCDHLAGEHDSDGCTNGWEYDAEGFAVTDGCPCVMCGPRR
jgi:hypothetical protein